MTDTVCAVDGCDTPTSPSGARGWCARHYQRWLRHGDPLTTHPPGRRRRPAAELFWTKVNLHGPVPLTRPELGPCWRWTAATRGGYGAFNAPATASGPRRRVDAHRWAYQTYVGPVPDGYELGHLCHAADIEHCDVGPACPHRACVNYQTHLVLLTSAAALHGIAAHHAAQTTCPQGHPYDRINAAGRRRCSRCMRAQADRWQAARGLLTRAEREAALDAWVAEITADEHPPRHLPPSHAPNGD